jgi:hypothetical protein
LRTAYALTLNVAHLAQVHGLERLGFLTLTFADHVTSIKEAQRRFNSLNSHVLKSRYRASIAVVERQKSGRLHFHLLVAMGADVRTGVSFDAFNLGDYRTAGPALRAEWSFWRKTAKLYRFGRTELLPVKSTADGISRYVGKYIAKHIGARCEADKGAKLVRYSQGAKCANTQFAWVSPRAWLWRKKLAKWAERFGFRSMEHIRIRYGTRWAYWLSEHIAAEVLDEWPTKAHAVADGREWAESLPDDARDVSVGSVGGKTETVTVEILWPSGRPPLPSDWQANRVFGCENHRPLRLVRDKVRPGATEVRVSCGRYVAGFVDLFAYVPSGAAGPESPQRSVPGV